MTWLIELLIFVMTGALIFHAMGSRSPQFALIFWSSGVVMGLFRELALSQISELYTYGNFSLSILGVPFVFLMLWTNLAYVSWEWTNNFLGTEYFHSKSFDQHLPLIFMTMILAAFFFEALLSQFQLIQWKTDTMPTLWGNTPVLAPFSYGFTAVVFLSGFKYLWNQPQQSWPVVAVKLISIQPMVVLIIMGLLFLTNLLIILAYVTGQS
jgi:hypothetical protein